MSTILIAALVTVTPPMEPNAVTDTVPAGYNEAHVAITNPAQTGYDPNLVVCRMEDQTGSRAKRRKVCLANHVWQQVAREGNAMANTIVDISRSGGLAY